MPGKPSPVLPPPRRGKSPYPTYKVLLVGDAAVGKSNLMTRFSNNQFDLNSKSTIGVDFVTREMDLGGTAEDLVPKGEEEAEQQQQHLSSSSGAATNKVNLQIWDTAGQERCGMVSSAFYRGARGVVVCYDVTRKQTLLNVPRWMAHAKQYADPNCIFMVVGNKNDLQNLRETSEEDAEEISHMLGVRHYFASALTGETVPVVFFQLALAVHSTALTLSGDSGPGDGGTQPTRASGGGGSNGGNSNGGGAPKDHPMAYAAPGTAAQNAKPDFRGAGSSGYNGMDPYRIQLSRAPDDNTDGNGGRRRRKKKGCPFD